MVLWNPCERLPARSSAAPAAIDTNTVEAVFGLFGATSTKKVEPLPRREEIVAFEDVTSLGCENELDVTDSLRVIVNVKGELSACCGEIPLILGATLSMLYVSCVAGSVLESATLLALVMSCCADKPSEIVSFRLERSPPETVTR